MADDALKREVSAAVRAQLREAWSYFADDENMLPAARLGDLLSHLHFGDRTMQLGKGLHRTQVAVGTLPSDVLFAAAALGMAPADVPGGKGAKRIAYPAFEKWFMKEKMGESGDARNRLLIKPTVGAVRASSYALPSSDFTYGAASKRNEVPMSAVLSQSLLAERAAAAAAASSVSPPKRRVVSPLKARAEAAAEGGRGHAPSAVAVGVRSLPSDPLEKLLKNSFAPAVDPAEERDYPDTSGKRTLGRLPQPRPTNTSLRRADYTMKHTPGLGSRAATASDSSPLYSSGEWKMSRFKDVPPRVPMDGTSGRR